MASLTVTVVTLDEAEGLPALLASVNGLADQIVVVDLGSGDGTVEVARASGAEVVSASAAPPLLPRMLALSLATGDYILDLDAGDHLDALLVAAIRDELARSGGPRRSRYRLRTRLCVLGRNLRFGRPWREPVRLFRRETGAAPPHLGEPAGLLPGSCERASYRELAEALSKLAGRAEREARARYRAGERWRAWYVLRGPATFMRNALWWLGIFDGATGITWAYLQARREALASSWLRRLEREIGGAAGRSPSVSRVREWGRRVLVSLASVVWPLPRRAMPAREEIRKILVVRPDERLGDQLLTSPLLRAIKSGLPKADLHLLAPRRQAIVCAACPYVDRVIPFEKRLAFRSPLRFIAQLRALHAEGYDVVVEAAHFSAFSLTASLLARIAAGRGVVIGHARGESRRFLSHPVVHDPAHANDIRAKLELLGPLSLAPEGLAPETRLGMDPANADCLLAASRVEAPYAVLNPGARMADRRWPPSAHALVARGLLARGFGVLVVWGPGEERIARVVAASSGARLAPPTGLEDLAALLRRASLCVSNNSGPMHLSVAVGTPTVGVFLAGESGRWGHELSTFEVAEPQSDSDIAAVLRACDRLIEGHALRGEKPASLPPS